MALVWVVVGGALVGLGVAVCRAIYRNGFDAGYLVGYREGVTKGSRVELTTKGREALR